MQSDFNRPSETDRARAALFAIPPDLPREEWVKVSMGAHSAQVPFQDWLAWCEMAGPPIFNHNDAVSTWRSFDDKPGGIGPGTLFHVAKQHGWHDDGAIPPQGKKPSKAPNRATKADDADAARVMAVNTIWPGLLPVTATESHPYIRRKQADGIDVSKLRIVPSDAPWLRHQQVGGYLAVPIYRADGTLQSAQFIPPGEGKKLNLRFTKVGGGRHVVGEIVPGRPVYLCEGIGQSWAAWQAVGSASVCCFGWGNVATVARQIRHDNPAATLVVVVDVGKESAAQALAREVNATLVYMPQDKGENYDCSDYARDFGVTELQALLENPQSPPTETTSTSDNSSEADGPPVETLREKLRVVFADTATEYSPPDELVEGLLSAEGASVLYGDSNSGKTFLAIDMAAAVARGTDWLGRRTEYGAVVYLASEAPQSVRNRLIAYQKHHACAVQNFAIVQRPVNFWQSDFDAHAITALVQEMERAGPKVRLVIADTLARVSAGANENSGEDMGQVIQRIDAIRAACNLHFMVIHHSGKNAAAGARGWSGIRAAIDTEIEVTETVAGRCAEVQKSRDLGTKGERIGFHLEQITLGTTKWGKPATCCIVAPADAPAAKPAKRMGEVEGAVVEFLAAKKVGVRKSDVVKHFDGRYEKGPIYRAMKTLVTAQAIHEAAGMVCIASVAS